MTEEPRGPERIWQLSGGYAPPLILEAAVRHGVFDVLDQGAKTLEELVLATRTSRRGLRALLNALVGLALLGREGKAYALTPESARYLVSGKPEFQGGVLRHVSRQVIPNWLHLAESVKTGRPSVRVNLEEEGAEYFRDFVEDLFPRNYPSARALAEALEIERAGDSLSVLDLATGSGVWSIALAERDPRIVVTAVDWPRVLAVTRRITARRGLSGQYRFVEGDLLRADFGTGHRVALLGHILHTEGAVRSQDLLRKVLSSLERGGTVAIAEFLPDDDRTGPAQPLIFALNMLVHTDDGDAFTFAEIRQWLEDAGFVDACRLDVGAASPLILAKRPG